MMVKVTENGIKLLSLIVTITKPRLTPPSPPPPIPPSKDHKHPSECEHFILFFTKSLKQVCLSLSNNSPVSLNILEFQQTQPTSVSNTSELTVNSATEWLQNSGFLSTLWPSMKNQGN